ncbi:MAG TPA: D-aminoacylase [Thermoanaerobaculia bacterium]|nr:D-aminoacylase [Thermoanaerobaculia bacterium]
MERLLARGCRQGALSLLVLALLVAVACAAPEADRAYDLVFTGGTVYDGSGSPGRLADIGIRGDRIAAIGDLSAVSARRVIDASGLAIAPGFVNMLSWSTESLLHDGRAVGEIHQGVTLQVFGEGESMGPWNEEQKKEVRTRQSEIRFDVDWTTLGEYLESLERRGVSTNVASFIGATTVRVHELGYEDRAATPEELERMRSLVREAMREGALGVGSSLIYAPAFYAPTEELIELARVAGEHDGMYISHMRSEGGALLEAVDELLRIAREAGVRAEIYHLKAGGRDNWEKMDQVIERVEAARADGLEITADMYTYTAGSTGLDAAMPPWVQEGGFDAWVSRLRDPAIRGRVEREITARGEGWENLYHDAGSPDNVLLVGFRNPELKRYTGKTVAEVAAERGTTPEATVVDLVIEDGSRVDTVYFLMSEENVERQIALPWVSFGSDAAAMAPDGVFLERSTHPRAYGNFARLLGRYVRERSVIPLGEAVRRLTALPAENLRLRERGRLEVGYFADLAVFDPLSIQDHATFEEPHQLATGMRHVVVNGTLVLEDGEHTGATPGRVVRGPGWTGWSASTESR